MTDTVERLEQEIAKLQSQLQTAREKQRKLENLEPDKRVAVFLHDKYCRSNHEDQCGWGWEMAGVEWGGHAHQYWLKQAQELLSLLRL